VNELKQVEIVRILPTAIWIEDDFCGGRHVMLQHEGMAPFCYASFHYNYAYTSNSGTWAEAQKLALALGATEPVERRSRSYAPPSTPKQGEGEYRYVEDASVPGGYRLKLIREDTP
jgi:hypothetical protein